MKTVSTVLSEVVVVSLLLGLELAYLTNMLIEYWVHI